MRFTHQYKAIEADAVARQPEIGLFMQELRTLRGVHPWMMVYQQGMAFVLMVEIRPYANPLDERVLRLGTRKFPLDKSPEESAKILADALEEIGKSCEALLLQYYKLYPTPPELQV